MTQPEFPSGRFRLTHLTMSEWMIFLENPKTDHINPFVLLSCTHFQKHKNPFVHSEKNGGILV